MPEAASVTHTTETAGSQDGRQTSALGWDSEAASTLNTEVLGPVDQLDIGLQFQLHPTGVPNDPFVIGSEGRVSLTFATLPAGAISVLAVRLGTGATLAAFSGTNLPVNMAGIEPYVRLDGTQPWAQGTVFSVTPVVAPQTFSFDVDLLGQGALGAYHWVAQTKNANGWNGKLSLLISLAATDPFTVAAAEHATITAPSLTMDEVAFYSGHSGAGALTGVEVGRKVTAVHSMRSGRPCLSDELIEDGYLPGVWVLEQEWEEPDPYDRDEYVPDPDEGGTVDLPAR